MTWKSYCVQRYRVATLEHAICFSYLVVCPIHICMILIFDTRHNFCFLKTRQTSYMILKKLKVQRCRVPRTAVVQSIRFSIQNAKFCWLPILPHTPCRTLPEACCILIIGNRLLGRQYLLRKRVESCSTDHPQVHAVL